jgi:hypothetical protein
VNPSFCLTLPAELGPAIQIDAENSPLDDLEKRVTPADLCAFQNQIRLRISANQRKWAVELMGDRTFDRSPRILAFKRKWGTQVASITE